MAKKKPKGDGVYFTGQSSIDVTGSQYLVKFGDKQCLLECGLHQSSTNSYLDSYKINSAKFAFRPDELDYLFVAHPHIDHCGLIPRLVKEGFRGKIISTKNTFAIMRALLLNCVYIVNEEAKILSKRYGRSYSPLFEYDDVIKTLELVEVYDEYNETVKLDDVVSFQWLKNSHCVGAAQLQLTLANNIKTRKILYTSDLGALKSRNHYVQNTEIPETFNDVVIMESTYGSKQRESKKTRDFDIEHLKTAIQTTIERGGTVIFPCFSFSRTQEILTTLYLIAEKLEEFNIPIYIDSKLSCEICELYSKILCGEDAKLWGKVINWEMVHTVTEKEASQMCVANNTPKIVISSSGFCTNGRIVNYLKKYLQDANSMIVFSGYVGDNPSYLSYRIKNYSDRSTISINKEKIKNKADCITLSTFSSHANHKDLVKFGSSLNTNKLILVHGSEESKRCLSAKLKEEISKNDKSYKVLCANKDMIIRL